MQNKNLNNDFIEHTTSVKDGKVNIPFVFSNENNEIHGFVPGFHMRDVVSKTIEDCEKMLYLKIKEEVLKRIQNNQTFPFFPDDKQIYEDFDDVVKIIRYDFEVPTLNWCIF